MIEGTDGADRTKYVKHLVLEQIRYAAEAVHRRLLGAVAHADTPATAPVLDEPATAEELAAVAYRRTVRSLCTLLGLDEQDYYQANPEYAPSDSDSDWS